MEGGEQAEAAGHEGEHPAPAQAGGEREGEEPVEGHLALEGPAEGVERLRPPVGIEHRPEQEGGGHEAGLGRRPPAVRKKPGGHQHDAEIECARQPIEGHQPGDAMREETPPAARRPVERPGGADDDEARNHEEDVDARRPGQQAAGTKALAPVPSQEQALRLGMMDHDHQRGESPQHLDGTEPHAVLSVMSRSVPLKRGYRDVKRGYNAKDVLAFEAKPREEPTQLTIVDGPWRRCGPFRLDEGRFGASRHSLRG